MELYWIWLSTIKYVGPVWQKKLLQHFSSPLNIFNATEEELNEIPKLNTRALSSILKSRSLKNSETIYQNSKNKNIKILTFDDPLYPKYAKECKDSPVVLYYKGELQKILTGIGVIGSRRCSQYGKKMAQQIGAELAGLNIPIISGFAKGIDTYAQTACVKNGGYTISFFASGVDICYPSEQIVLYHEFLEKGCVFISEYPPGTPAVPRQFVKRNSLISAWSEALIVVEAGKNSGALWTANYAMGQGKQTYAVPNRIDEPNAEGSNKLLEKGSKPYLSIESLHIPQPILENKTIIQSSPSSHIDWIHSLTKSTYSISQLATILSLSEDTILNQLLSLELDGKVYIRGNQVSII